LLGGGIPHFRALLPHVLLCPRLLHHAQRGHIPHLLLEGGTLHYSMPLQLRL